jgi:predicted O-methyltransferase YrrM
MVGLHREKMKVVELGSYHGLTTLHLLDGLRDGDMLIAVELDKERANTTTGRLSDWALENYAKARPNWQVFCGDSLDFLGRARPHSIDFCFVDDTHAADHVAKELELLLKPNARGEAKMSPGGIVTMHDVTGHFGLGDVCRRFHGYVLDLPRIHQAGGLGIVQMPYD